ncbi:50S ribosomal protein L31 [Candidatus Daviesbacteria bacterium]|nr:50S ribosomal protein L31 [Candidatus Daviesbacteria bacterium]
MKANLHPIWYPDAQVSCACGNTFTSGSILPKIRVEICSNCHPFFTGSQKLVDTLGQVDKYYRKTEVSKVKQAERKKILEFRQSRVEKRKSERPSLKELLMQARKKVSS